MTLGYNLLGCHSVQRLEQRHFFHTHGLDTAEHYLLSVSDPHGLWHLQLLQGICVDLGSEAEHASRLGIIYHTIYGLAPMAAPSGTTGTAALRGSHCLL
jgi:hypothetical protein